jgi:hypothetical protein
MQSASRLMRQASLSVLIVSLISLLPGLGRVAVSRAAAPRQSSSTAGQGRGPRPAIARRKAARFYQLQG